MSEPNVTHQLRKRKLIVGVTVGFLALFAGCFYLYGQDKSSFPDGYDAVQAAPDTHKVIFENEFVRVLEVSVQNGPPGRAGAKAKKYHTRPSP